MHQHTRRRRVTTAIGIAALIMSSAACSYSNTESNEVTCVYNGGPLDDRLFREYQKPGAGKKDKGLFSEEVGIPTGGRTFQLDPYDPAKSDTGIAEGLKVTVKSMQMIFPVTVKFTISTVVDEEGKPAACKLYETQLKQLNATDFDVPGGNWQRLFLGDRVYSELLTSGARMLTQPKYDPFNLFKNTRIGDDDLGARDRAATELEAEFSGALVEAFGGNKFFCGPDSPTLGTAAQCGNVRITLGEPQVSDANRDILTRSDVAKQSADAAIAAVKEQTRQADGEAAELEAQVGANERAAEARRKIAESKVETANQDAISAYAWCSQIVALGGTVQDCINMKVAESGQWPTINLGSGASPLVQLPTEPTVPAGG